MITVGLLRHAESTANIGRLMGINPDASLTEKGVEQAKTVAAELSDINIDLILSSALRRAKQTAEIVAETKHASIMSTDLLNERSYGRFNGWTEEAIAKELGEIFIRYKSMSAAEVHTARLDPSMESAEEALQRILTVIHSLDALFSDKTILLVTHSTLMRVLLIHMKSVGHEEIGKKGIGNTAQMFIHTNGGNLNLVSTRRILKNNGDPVMGVA